MAKYLAVAKNLITGIKSVNIKQVGRDVNAHVDALVGLASVLGGDIGRPSQLT